MVDGEACNEAMAAYIGVVVDSLASMVDDPGTPFDQCFVGNSFAWQAAAGIVEGIVDIVVGVAVN